jgi:hypothetical protein
MSRTIRRKNAWDAKYFVGTNARNEWYIQLLQGKTDVHSWGAGKYRGCTNEQVIEKLNAIYHGDNWGDWKVHHNFKKAAKKRQRALNDAELVKYVQGDLEEDYHFSTKREVRGKMIWDYY